MGTMPQLWWRPFLARLQGMEGDQGEALHLLGKLNTQPRFPIWTGHWNGTLGPLDSKEGDGEGIALQGLDSRGEHRVGQEMRGTSELQVKRLRENAVLPV